MTNLPFVASTDCNPGYPGDKRRIGPQGVWSCGPMVGESVITTFSTYWRSVEGGKTRGSNHRVSRATIECPEPADGWSSLAQ
jgi:hypothetical protein